jgi:hypothetical protein
MRKKTLIIVILAIIAMSVLIFTGYKIHGHFSNSGTISEVDKYEIEMQYRQQNDAFYGLASTISFMPYSKEFEWTTQVHINYYMRQTGKTITVHDIETFLATSENPNGTPRTWKDDKTGIVYDFVEWFQQAKGIYEFRFYGDDLQLILTYYRDEHPGCPYITLSDLTPEQIIELDNEFRNPGNLVLKW